MSEVKLTRTAIRGLEICVAVVPWARGFTSILHVETGYGADPRERAGLAHLCEHERIAQAARSVPAATLTVNGLTEAGWTRFQGSADPADWRTAVDRTLAMFGPERLDPPTLATETSAMLIEMERAVSSPALRLGPLMAATVLPGTDLARLGDACEETVRVITDTDLDAFLDRHYRPSNARLIIASPVPAEDIVAHLSEWAAPVRDSPVMTSASTSTSTSASASSSTSASASAASTSAAAFTGDESAGAWVATLIVDRSAAAHGAEVGAIARRIAMDTRGPIERVSLRHGYRVSGASVLRGSVHDLAILSWGAVEPSKAVLDDLYRAFRQDPEFAVPEKDLEVARRLAAVAHSFEHQTASGLAGQLARWLSRTGPRPMAAEQVEAVSLRDIHDSLTGLLRSAQLWRWGNGGIHRMEGSA